MVNLQWDIDIKGGPSGWIKKRASLTQHQPPTPVTRAWYVPRWENNLGAIMEMDLHDLVRQLEQNRAPRAQPFLDKPRTDHDGPDHFRVKTHLVSKNAWLYSKRTQNRPLKKIVHNGLTPGTTGSSAWNMSRRICRQGSKTEMTLRASTWRTNVPSPKKRS